MATYITLPYSSTWGCWVTSGTSSTATGSVVWSDWCDATTTCSTSASTTANYRPHIPPPETAEERDARLAAQAERDREYQKRLAEEKAAREKAEARAKELLLSLLNAEQKLEFEKEKRFTVNAKDGRAYRLRPGWSGNVEELNKEGKPVNRLCIHPVNRVAEHDNLIAQKCMIETNPALFHKTANKTALPV